MLTRKRRGGPATRLGAVFLSLALIFILILGISALVLAEEATVETPEAIETPIEETPAGTPEAIETPAEEAPVETPEAIETPIEEAPAGTPEAIETPAEEAPVETPAEEAPIETLGQELASINIKTMPAKIVYHPMQFLDLAGLVVEAVYDDDTKANLSSGDYAVDPADGTLMGTPTGTRIVTVTYPKTGDNQKTATFAVTVQDGTPTATTSGAFTCQLSSGLYGVTKYNKNGNYNFKNVVVLDSVGTNQVKAVHTKAFEGATMKSLMVRTVLTTINSQAFLDCTALTTVDLGTTNLNNVKSKVTTIGDYAFQGCTSLESIYLPAAVATIGKNPFLACTKLEEIKVYPDNTKFKDIDGVLFSLDGKTLLAYPAGRADTEYIVPEGTENIGPDAFRFQVNGTKTFTSPLKSVIFPSTLKKINAGAFMYGDLEEITIFPGIQIDSTAFDNCPDLKTVHVAEGVTELPQRAFDAVYAEIENLEELTLPSGLKVIGASALQGYPLESIELPAGLETIGNNAFADSALTSITLPAGLQINTLPASAFKGCTELTSVHLPAAISGTEDAAFWNCSGLTVEYDAPRLLRSPLDCYEFILNNEASYELREDGFYYTNRELQLGGTLVPEGYKLEPQQDGVTFTYTGNPADKIEPAITSVSASPGTGGDTEVLVEIVAEGIQAGDIVEIKAEPKTTGDTITGEGIAVLGKGDKRGYFVVLKTLTLGGGTSEDYNVFASLDGNTWVDSGGEVIKLNSIQVTKLPVSSICTAGDKLDLTGLEVTAYYTDSSSKILAGNAYITEPADGAVLTESGDRTVTVTYTESGIQKTANFTVTVKTLDFIQVTTLPAKTTYTAGESLDFTGLEVTASYTDGSTQILKEDAYTTVPANGFEMTTSGVQTVTVKYPKIDGPNQRSVTFKATIATPDSAFEFAAAADGESYIVKEYLGGHPDVVVPGIHNGKPVTAIGAEAFDKNVTTVTLPDSIISIGEKAFYSRVNMKSINLGQGVKNIGQQAFQYCNALETINLPASVEAIGWNAFGFCQKLTDIKVDENNNKFKDIGGVLFSKDGKTLVYYPATGRTAEIYEVPYGTERIGEDAFRIGYEETLSNALASVTLPTTLTAIGDRAFYQSSLQEVTVYPGITMGEGVYELCKNLRTVKVEEGVTKLPKNIFYAAENLKNLTLPSTLKVIGEGALQRYPLASIDLPEGLEVIGTNAFYEAKLTSVTIPALVTTLGDSAFGSNRVLTTVRFAEDTQIAAINQHAFATCESLTDIILPNSLKTLETGVFKGCLKLTSIDLPYGLTTLGDYVFASTGIETMTFPDSVTKMGSHTFYFCNALTSVTFPKELEKLGEQTFRYCREKLSNVVFPETVKLDTLPAGTFWECFSLRKVHLPAAISGTDDAAFYGCIVLTVEYDAPMLRRSPLDCVGLILNNDSLLDLREDGIYCTNTQISDGINTWEPGTPLVPPSDQDITFIYTGDPTKKIQPAIRSVSASEAASGNARVEVEAQGIEAKDRIQIKAVHKTTGYEITGNGVAALGKGERRGYFAAVKTLTLDVGAFENYNVYASIDGDTWVGVGGQTVALDYIRVTNPPAKTKYTVGEMLDLTGMEVKAFYSDGSNETLASGAYTTEPADGSKLNTAGTQTVTVKYTKNGIEKTASFDVTVSSGQTAGLDAIKVTKHPAKTEYTVGGTLDLTGLEVTAVYTDKSEKPVTGYTTSPANGAELKDTGTQTVTVTYKEGNIEKTVSFAVTVNRGGGGGGSGGGSKTPDPAAESDTTKSPDGTVRTVVKNPDNSVTTTETRSDGTEITTQTTASGNTSAMVTVPGGKGQVTVTIPTSQKPGAGDVAVIVHPDGTREVVKTSVATENGLQVTLREGARLEIVDNSRHFDDTPAASWAAEAVNFVSSREIFTGTSESSFSPNAGMTRAMLMTALYRIDGGTASGNGENWYSDALEWSKEQGLSDGSNPNGSITREQLAAILYRHAGSPASGGSLESFRDQDEVSDWSADALRWAVEEGLISGRSNGVLDSGGSATRAEVAAILMRYLSK